MNIINKQKFLAELGRLLTFMYEEDRQTALAMYSKMFDDAAEEQMLLQFLISPPGRPFFWPALTTPRSASSSCMPSPGKRRLTTAIMTASSAFHSGYRRSAAGRRSSGHLLPVEDAQPVDEDQFSLFDEISSPAKETSPAPAAENSAPVQEQPRPSPMSPRRRRTPCPKFADAVDAFLADFSIADGELVPSHSEQGEPEPEEEAAPQFDDQPFHLEELSHQPASQETEEPPAPAEEEVLIDVREEDYSPLEEAPAATVRKARVFPLILYIIFSIPITLLGVLLLLIPTLFSLSFAVTFVSSGVLVLTGALAGFSIFADLMVILGLAIVLLAIGLLFTWLFIWFIGGAIAGLIRGVIRFGGKWCCKEVDVR
ncbi:MAG: hypothetical protein V8T45_07425 [Oscillospiraceae bacterium]